MQPFVRVQVQGLCQHFTPLNLHRNKSAIALCKNPVHHDRTKHIDIKFHKIRQCIEEGKLDVDHVRTDAQLADALTKALGRTRFIEMRVKLGVPDASLGSWLTSVCEQSKLHIKLVLDVQCLVIPPKLAVARSLMHHLERVAASMCCM